jgi:Protein of unknown function (DUF3891)
MIVRGEQNGGVVLVNQTDHSQLVGQLAAHWGNEQFDAPRPYESVVRAAVYHDFGWLPYETTPGSDPESGKPYGFLQVGLKGTQLKAYRWVVDWMNEIDPYSALIMCMHRTGLWRGRYGTIDYPTAFNFTDPPPDIAKFTDENERWQADQKQKCDQDELWTNYRLMQVWDLLGLYFCCQDVRDDYIDPVPVKYSSKGDRGVRMSMKADGRNRVSFSPYPFDVRPLKVQLRLKHLSGTSFDGDHAFRKAYYQANNEGLEFEIS